MLPFGGMTETDGGDRGAGDSGVGAVSCELVAETSGVATGNSVSGVASDVSGSLLAGAGGENVAEARCDSIAAP